MLDSDLSFGLSDAQSSSGAPWRLIADRSAVLIVGLVAGFSVGLCFAPPSLHGEAGDAPGAGAVPPASVPVAAAPAVPAQGIDARVVARVAKTGRIRIGVFGDSFAVGVWDALYRLLPAADGYDVLRFGREATGFTRYRVADLSEQARGDVVGEPIDIAVISVGVNDAQDMWEGKLYPFMSDGWKGVVGPRIDSLVAAARSSGAAVYWVGLPTMRDPALDAKVQTLNAFFADRAIRLGVPFVATRALSVDAGGRYASHLPDPVSGASRLMRTNDGIHMIGIGYQRIVAPAVQQIRALAARVRAAAGRPAPQGTVR